MAKLHWTLAKLKAHGGRRRAVAAAATVVGPNEEDADAWSAVEADAVLCLELRTGITVANRARLPVLWPLLHTYFKRVLGEAAAARAGGLLVERAAVNLLRVNALLLPAPRRRRSAPSCRSAASLACDAMP